MSLRTIFSTVVFVALVFGAPVVVYEVYTALEPVEAQVDSRARGDTCGALMTAKPEQVVATSVLIAYGFDNGYGLALDSVGLPLDPEPYTIADLATRFMEVCVQPEASTMLLRDAMMIAYQAQVLDRNRAGR